MGNQVDSARFMASNAKNSVVNRVDYGIYRVFSIFGEASDSLENIIFRNFNEDQFTQLKEIFTQLDTNKDGSLSREEFRSFFSKAQGLAASSEEIENMVCLLLVLILIDLI